MNYQLHDRNPPPLTCEILIDLFNGARNALGGVLKINLHNHYYYNHHTPGRMESYYRLSMA